MYRGKQYSKWRWSCNMVRARAKGSITIVDLTDSRQLVAYIASSNRRQVIYDPNEDKYFPNYSEEPNTLYPELYVAGGGNNIISQAKSVKWTVQTNSIGSFDDIPDNNDYSYGDNSSLVIENNVLENNLSMLYRVEIVYHDVNIGRDIIIQADIELVRLTNGSRGVDGTPGADGKDGADGLDGEDGKDAVLLTIETPDGTTIRNQEGTLTAVSELFVGTSLVSNGITHKWYKRLPGATGDADSGTGWQRLTDSNNFGTTGYDSDTLTIPPEGITGNATYMVIVSYEGENFRRQLTVNDITDPYTIAVLGDSFFKNGQGQNTYTAKVYRNGEEVDEEGNQGYTYTWHQYSSTGEKIVGFEKTGKTITVTSAEFSGKSDLRVTVRK